MNKHDVCKPEVYSSIYNAQANDLYNYLFYKFGDKQTAEDIVQESFIKLWNNCAKIIFDKAKAYLFSVASNMFIDVKRHDKVVLKYQNSKPGKLNIETPEFVIEEKEFMVKLQKTIGSLPDKQREVFLLNRIDKKTYKEIANMLNISVKAVEKRMHNALKIVRKDIGNI